MTLSDGLLCLGVCFLYMLIIFCVISQNIAKKAGGNDKLKDRIIFYKKKWQKKNIWKYIVLTIIFLICDVLGVVFNTNYLFYLGYAIFFIGILSLNNKMMTYVESKAFNGKGPQN